MAALIYHNDFSEETNLKTGIDYDLIRTVNTLQNQPSFSYCNHDLIEYNALVYNYYTKQWDTPPATATEFYSFIPLEESTTSLFYINSTNNHLYVNNTDIEAILQNILIYNDTYQRISAVTNNDNLCLITIYISSYYLDNNYYSGYFTFSIRVTQKK